jgi:hypothetical protein
LLFGTSESGARICNRGECYSDLAGLTGGSSQRRNMTEIAELKSFSLSHNSETADASDLVEHRSQKRSPRWLAFALVFVVLFLFASIRWRLRDMPLERDEGEYAYAGQLILQGIPPYELAYNMKLPGTYLAYAAILRVFGETPAGIHIGLLLVNGCATLLVFFLGRRLYGNLAGVTDSSQLRSRLYKRSGAGAGGTRDTFCCTDGPPGPSIFAGGTPIKESANIFCRRTFDGSGFPDETAGSGVHRLWRTRNIVERMEGTRGQKEIGSAARRVRGGSGNSVFTDLRGTLQGRDIWKVLVLDSFVCEPIRYVNGTCAGFAVFSENCATTFFWCASSVVFRGHRNFRGNQGTRQKRGFELHHQFAGVVLRWSQRGTLLPRSLLYLMLPAICLLAGKAMKWLTEDIAQRVQFKKLVTVPAALFVVGYGASLYSQRAELFEMSPASVIRQEYGGNPFPDARIWEIQQGTF